MESVGVLFLVTGIWTIYCGLFGLHPAQLAAQIVQNPGNASTLVATARQAAATSLKTLGQATTDSSGAPAAGVKNPNNPGTSASAAQAYAQSRLSAYGWDASQWPFLLALWNQESGWNYAATNSSSGAYGIPQALPASKMATFGADWKTNPATQIEWGLSYIKGRYGSPQSAEAHEKSQGWY